jgi:hypothetical protein
MTKNTTVAATVIQLVGSQSADPSAIILDAEFERIKKHAKLAFDGRINSRKQFNKAFAGLIVFFVRADKDLNYLDKFYQTGVKAHKRSVNHGYNFAPLIEEVWGGLEKKLETNKKNRWSRAMNNLLKIYKSDPKYQTDSVNQLAALLRRPPIFSSTGLWSPGVNLTVLNKCLGVGQRG